MQQDPNPIALGLIIVGALMSLGRDQLAVVYTNIYMKIKNKKADPRMKKAIALYLMMSGMALTIGGLLIMFDVVTL